MRDEAPIKRVFSTDNEAQGQSAKLVDANGVILCLHWHERLPDFYYVLKDEKTLVEILKIDVNKLHAVHQVSAYSRAVLKADRLI